MTYAFKLLHIVIGEHVCILQILLWIQGIPHQTLPEGSQEVQRKWHVCTDGYAQELTKEVEKLFFCVAYGARRQDVLPLNQ